MGHQRAGRHQGRGLRLRDRRSASSSSRPPTSRRSSRRPSRRRRRGAQRARAAAVAVGQRRRADGVRRRPGVFVAAAVVFFAYSGFEAVANLGEETKDPGQGHAPRADRHAGRSAPCSTCWSAWCSPAWSSYTDLVRGRPDLRRLRPGRAGLGRHPDRASPRSPGLTSVILVDIVAMGRIGFALCRDGLLPAVGRPGAPEVPHPDRGSPSARPPWCACSAAFVPLDTLAEMVSIGTLFAFFVVSIAVVGAAPHRRRR